MSRRHGSSAKSRLPALAMLAGLAVADACAAQESFTNTGPAEFPHEGQASEQPRGTITIGYQMQHTKGLIMDNGDIPGKTTTDAHILFVAVDYRLNDRWEAHAQLPFIDKRSSGGPGAHDPSILTVPHPEAAFLDDGNYHSAWQDWILGVSYHANWGRLQVEPHLIAQIPSHDYSHFANAAIGQNLWRLKLGVDFTHRLESSNFHYRFGYSYEVWEKVLGIGLNKHHFRSSAGYFFSPQVTGWVFANARIGQGLNTTEVGSNRTSELWYQHDRLSEHDFVIAGIGASYRINDRYSISATGGRMVWGRNVHDLKYAYDVALSRGF